MRNWYGFLSWVSITCDCSGGVSFYTPDSITVLRFLSLTEDADCSFSLFAAKAFLSPLLITKMSIMSWFATGEDLFKWCTLHTVALTLSASFPVFRQSIDSLSTLPFFMLNDAPSLLFTLSLSLYQLRSAALYLTASSCETVDFHLLNIKNIL